MCIGYSIHVACCELLFVFVRTGSNNCFGKALGLLGAGRAAARHRPPSLPMRQHSCTRVKTYGSVLYEKPKWIKPVVLTGKPRSSENKALKPSKERKRAAHSKTLAARRTLAPFKTHEETPRQSLGAGYRVGCGHSAHLEIRPCLPTFSHRQGYSTGGHRREGGKSF